MEVNSNALTEVASCLIATLNPSTRKEAEARLSSFETALPDLPNLLLSLTRTPVLNQLSLPSKVNVPAVLLLKNLLRAHWGNIDSPLLTLSVRDKLKDEVFVCLAEASDGVRAQLSEIILIIAQNDFPEGWPGLIECFLGRISTENFSMNLIVLKTLHRIFKRYRLEERSDDLYREINYVMSKFGPALLQLYQMIDSAISRHNEASSIELEYILQNARYLNKIFYSLSFQDIPEFIEDHLEQFMQIIMRFFVFQSQKLSSSDPEEPGVGEQLASSVAKIVILYSSRYEDDFKMLSDFAQATWNILTARISLYPKDDKLACTCMEFLASVARQERHKDIFQGIVPLICEKVIISNMQIRESDLEMFEDDPLEFIRRDSEGGNEVSTRVGASVNLVRSLMEFNEVEVTQILFSSVQGNLDAYNSQPSQNWKFKLLATQLFSAIGARGSAESFGVTRTNALLNVGEFYHHHVLPDLQSGNQFELHPLLQLEAIKFVANYRHQLTKDDLVTCLPMLLTSLESKNYIIHTFAALAVEKVLSIRQGGELMFSPADISSVTGRLTVNILALIFNNKTVEKMCENHFLVKAFTRVLALSQGPEVEEICRKFLDRLVWLLGEVIKNPLNPTFNHFLFESLVLLIRNSSGKPEIFSALEGKLVPSLFSILQAEQTEFFPYSFQVFSAFVDHQPPSKALPDYVKSLLPALTQPALWSIPGNVPALVRLLQSCFRTEPALFSTPAFIESALSIFRVLLNSKTNDAQGFALISGLFGILSADLIEAYLRPVFLMILSRVQAHKTQKLGVYFLEFISFLIIESNYRGRSVGIVQIFAQIQSNIIFMLFKSLFVPIITKIVEPSEKKCVILSVTELLCALDHPNKSSPEESSIWFSALSEVVKASTLNTDKPTPSSEDPTLSGLHSQSSRLASLPPVKKFFKLECFPPADSFLLKRLKDFCSCNPALSAMIQEKLDDSARLQLSALLQKFGTCL